MREGQLALRAGAASGILVPVTDQRVATMFDEIEIIGNDLADGLLKAMKIAGFPWAKFAHFSFREIFHLVERGIIHLMTQRFQQRRDFSTPAFARSGEYSMEPAR